MPIRKFDFLVSLYIFGVIVSEVMGAKTFALPHFFGSHLNASVAIFVMPLLFSVTDIIVEVFGKARARSVVLSGLVIVALLTLFATFYVNLPPSTRFQPTEAAYDTIFSTTIRFSLASIVAFAVSELLDVVIFSKLREHLGKKDLWFRNNASNFVSQFADSLVFLTLAFYTFSESFGGNTSFIIGLLIPYWLLRCLLSVIETPLVYAGVHWFKNDPEAKQALTDEAKRR